MQVIRPNFEKRDGLITVVVQDYHTREILMVAYANEQAYRQTLETGIATFWSTSRNELWVKGATSNNLQKLIWAYVDCDGDAVIYHVEPQGQKRACHTNAGSCFYRNLLGEMIEDAPKAGKAEELQTMEVVLHESLQ